MTQFYYNLIKMSVVFLKTSISEYESKINTIDSKIKITKSLVREHNNKYNERKRLYSYEPYDTSNIEPKVCLKSIKKT
tara:strand:- start:1670 stop:1903 length:234 start_codon:yes stop_codon:yes gene_type:complete